VDAGAALGRVERHHRVADAHARHALPNALHDASALVAEDAGEGALAVLAGEGVEVRAADSGRRKAHAHLASAGRRNVHLLDNEGRLG